MRGDAGSCRGNYRANATLSSSHDARRPWETGHEDCYRGRE
jgi:hypothetical protein